MASIELMSVAYVRNPGVRVTATLANTAAETGVLGHTIPAAYLASFNSITFRVTFVVSTAAGLGVTLTVRIKLGSSVLTVVSSTIAGGLSNATFRVEASITNQGTTPPTQSASGILYQNPGGVFGSLGPNVMTASASDWTTDTSTDQLALATVQFGTASPANSLRAIQGNMTFG